MRNCESFMTDYERAMKNALKSLYGIDVKYLSCWFHVSQAVKRQASKVDGFFHRGQPALFDRRHLQNIAGRPILTIIFFLHRIRAKGICSFFACFFFLLLFDDFYLHVRAHCLVSDIPIRICAYDFQEDILLFPCSIASTTMFCPLIVRL